MSGQNIRPPEPPEPGLAVAEVAKKLGVAPATLRTWDRRYGLTPSLRTAGAHRRYTAVDIARLELMRAHTMAGLAPSDAALIAARVPEAQLDVVPIVPVPGLSTPGLGFTDFSQGDADIPDAPIDFFDAAADGAVLSTDADAVISDDDATVVGISDNFPRPRTGLSDAAIPDAESQPPAEPSRRPALTLLPGLPPDSPALRVGAAIDAALAFDELACLKALRLTPAETDVVAWWTELARPTLTELAKRVVLSPPGRAPFAIAETATLKAIGEYLQGHDLNLAAAGQPPSGHPSRLKKLVLVVADPSGTATPDAHALAAAVVAEGAAARVVTGAVDTRRLLELVLLSSPLALVVAFGAASQQPRLLAELQAAHPAVPVFVELPPGAEPLRFQSKQPLPTAEGIQQVADFAELVALIGAVVKERGLLVKERGL